MPSSNLTLAPQIIAMAHDALARAGCFDEGQHSRVLDVGPGHGKYGLLVREFVARNATIWAIEEEARYFAAFPWLKEIYDVVVNMPAQDASTAFYEQYDLVLMIDVLEHLEHEVGAALLARIPCRVIVCTPRDFFQNPEADQGWESERHRSVWTAEEIADVRPLEVHDIDAEKIGAVLVTCAPLP